MWCCISRNGFHSAEVKKALAFSLAASFISQKDEVEKIEP